MCMDNACVKGGGGAEGDRKPTYVGSPLSTKV